MPTYRITAPDGKTYDVTGPDGSTPEQALEQVKAQLASKPAEPAAVQAGRGLMEIPRQVGLAARYGLEGLAQVGDIFHEPIRALVNAGSGDKPRASKSLTQMASGLADEIGLPAPENANERVIGDASRMVAGVGGLSGASQAGAKITTGLAQKTLNLLAANPGKQAISAATGGLAGGSVREAGGTPLEQFGASLLGGLAGGAAAGLAERGANTVKAALTPKATELQRADQQIALVLERQGINWQDVPERIKQSMRAEAAQAMSTGGGQLNGDALRRLLVMRRAGVTPTVGQLTQDPGLITREINLAKTGANSTDPSLQRLAGIQNENTRNLLSRLDEAGAANALSAPDTSRAAIGSLQGVADRARANVSDLYSQARDTAGRSLPLEGGAFTRRASQLIDEAMVGGALPKGVESTLNKIAAGEMPLTVEIAEQLKTQMGKLQRATNDGQARYALGLVRQALDEAPLQASPPVNPGNLPVPGTVPASAQAVGRESINAFNEARGAHRAFMQRVEASPALRAVVDGVEPDQFVNRYVLSKQASAADVATLRNDLNPESAQTIRNFLVKHLRDAATNSTDDVTKFSNAAYRKALRDIGDEKLAVFFSPEERQLLQDVGEAAKYMQAQPAGSAVNNSNSGALLIGRGLDMLEGISQKLPLGLRDVISGTIQGQQQRQVLTPANALALPAPPKQPANLFSLPLLAGSASAQGSNDEGRDKRAKKDRVN